MLCEYMKTGCVMKEEYRKRADNFYAQNDHHNCERIYQEIMKFQKQIDIDKLDVYKRQGCGYLIRKYFTNFMNAFKEHYRFKIFLLFCVGTFSAFINKQVDKMCIRDSMGI